MIIGKQFVWGHLGKTGGDATLTLFRLFPELIVSTDEVRSQIKHTSFAAREHEIRGKLLFLNIRKLPSWLLSRAQHRARYGLYPDFKPLPMPSPDELAQSKQADRSLNHFLDSGRFKIDKWIRTEFLKEDFLAAVAELTEISEEKRQKVREVVMTNSMRYDHDVNRWFTEEHIKAMYANNPIWASIEQEVYKTDVIGDLQPHRQVGNIREIVRTIVPYRATVVVVSKGDEELLQLDVRRAWHFPQDGEGAYAGYHPADGAEAISHLEELRAKGAQYLLFPGTALWWLEHYEEFREYLNSRYRRMRSDKCCVIYQLCRAEPGSGAVDS